MENHLYLKLDEQRKIIQEDIKEITYKRLLEIYQQNIPKNILERYEYELKIILENKYENIYMLLYLISNKVKEDNEIMLLSGTIGSSFIVYLLEVTEINPIEYNIPFEVSCGIEGNRKPDFAIVFSERYLVEIRNYIECILKENNLLTDETANDGLKLYLRENSYLDIVLKLEKATDKKRTTILIDDEETMKLIKNADTLGVSEFNHIFVRNMILEIQPNNFEDLVKISGLSHGTDVWTNNAQELIERGIATLNEVITCRDDIMNYLIKQGIEKEIAFNIMEVVRKGRIRENREEKWEEYKEIMKKHNVPNWYIKSCEKIRYLFPRAHAINYVMNSFRLAYYKAHYPKEFYQAYFEVMAVPALDMNALNSKSYVLESINFFNENCREKSYYSNSIMFYETALEMNEKGIQIDC